MPKQSIIFLGSKPIGYHCLKHLIEQKDMHAMEIVAAFSNDNPAFDQSLSVTKLALESKIPVLTNLNEMPECDYLYSVQYHKILTKQQIAKARFLALNLHMAPLPEYRGCNQFSFAILDNKKEFGTTVHVMDERIDHGDILFEKRFPIPDHCWVQQLYELTFEASLNLFKESLSDIFNGQYNRVSQQSLIESRGSSIHYRNEIQALKQIDLNWDAEKISRHIRATSMTGFEPPYTLIADKKVYFCNSWQ